jgi:hypothetical protein
MNSTREEIYSALFNLVSTAAGFVTIGRRYKPWSEIPPEQQPAMFQVQRTESPVQLTGMPAAWRLDLDLVIYVHTTGNPDIIASTIMNPILDAVTSLFDASTPLGKQTLGGLVHMAKVSGAIETDEGVLGDQAFALIPIEIITY